MVKNGIHTTEEVWEALHKVHDPEIPVLSLVDLNVIREVEVDGSSVSVRMVPTFAGCPALELMRREVEEHLRGMGFTSVNVTIDLTKRWTTDALSPQTRQKLRDFGIAPPEYRHGDITAASGKPVPCPFCNSDETRMDSEFGATLCKQLFYCDSCKQSFERFKPL